MNKNYNYQQNELIFQKIWKDKFKEVTFLDFKDFPLNDSDFADIEHLNDKGAKKFSTYFNTFMKDNSSKD